MNSPSHPGSPVPGGPLNPLSPGRANTPRESSFMNSLRSELRDSSVHDKISQFNTLALGKSVERKNADAALKRAMLGREEAEDELRRYREENKVLRVQLDKSKEREQRVSERLETVMDQYGRAKETFAHTKTAWEKEIKVARKKVFKHDATIIRLQEELKAARDGWRAASDNVDSEKARNQQREQEAFEARFQMVGLEEQLSEALERVKVLEQERDAFKTLAKEEEVARIAAEGRIPLPKFERHDDEFASPRKKQRTSMTTAMVTTSAANEEEVEELSRKIDWERRRADRAYEMIDFLHAECELRTCEASKFLKRRHILSPHRVLVAPTEVGPSDLRILGRASASVTSSRRESQDSNQEISFVKPEMPSLKRKSRDEPRRSTIFCAREGIFRTVSMQEAEALEAAEKERDQARPTVQSPSPRPSLDRPQSAEDHSDEQPTPRDRLPEPRMYARTPSVEPPSFALLAQERMSLASLLNAPHGDAQANIPEMNIPTMPDVVERAGEEEEEEQKEIEEEQTVIETKVEVETQSVEVETQAKQRSTSPEDSPPRALSNAGSYRTSTTTTSIPIHDDEANPPSRPVSRFDRARTPSGESHASFDVNNPAMTPTCTREEALARIRERRGRARSAAQGAATPRKPILQGPGSRRDMSAPTATTTAASSTATSAKRAASRVRKAR
ncbi:hypothetical protein F5X68DRAFT_80480 [Plectosphaerella plurivora]|uniref:Uncharacterized protein n=1 Tax=Plectosphaerella plurivora TaxID=936078 RepID=A0A9P9ABW9_9PEZI|nr:hypothetical protein F5X68DRAFT_80480 [Plectosphaerella plurivora]